MFLALIAIAEAEAEDDNQNDDEPRTAVVAENAAYAVTAHYLFLPMILISSRERDLLTGERSPGSISPFYSGADGMLLNESRRRIYRLRLCLSIQPAQVLSACDFLTEVHDNLRDLGARRAVLGQETAVRAVDNILAGRPVQGIYGKGRNAFLIGERVIA